LAAENLENTRHQFRLNLSSAQHALIRLRDAKAFSNLRIPYFLIADQNGKILTADVELQSLDFNLNNYLKPRSGI
jgi:hypothetical protein